MGLITFKTKFSSLQNDNSLRIDAKYHSLMNKTGFDIFESNSPNLILLKSILQPYYQPFEFKESEDYFGIPTGKNFTDDFGDIINFQTITKEDHPDRLKYKADENCILISSLKGARTPALKFEFDLSRYVFSNGFYIFKINENWNEKFVLYLLRTDRLKYILDNHIYRGIGISSYKQDDLLKILIPKIKKTTQDIIIERINPIEEEINTLKKNKIQPIEIFNQVFSDYFKINLKDIEKLENKRNLSISLSNTNISNSALRSGFRWNKMQYIQTNMYSNISCIKTLGQFIKSSKNGWSPLSVEGGVGTPILGQENFSSSGVLAVEPSKATEETRNNIKDFFIKKGDFFVSRGNTVDLVALASIVDTEIKEDILFPDLYILLELNENYINKTYLSYIFNSFIGRLYFKYVSKGKNQTMVKVSSIELLNFKLPIPTLIEQKKLVEIIQKKLDMQKIVNKQIKVKQQKISELIEEALKIENF
ncbi:hypothetical protein WH285_02655 [Acinetobacter johnsonii]|uniref:hypothetical protein n=1 Tax=Acinetobacter johnsonii TaxID=40214 RepID=UPI0030B4F7B5